MVFQWIDRLFRNTAHEERKRAIDHEIITQKEALRQNDLRLQSGMRVVQRNMAGAMRMVMEADGGKDRR